MRVACRWCWESSCGRARGEELTRLVNLTRRSLSSRAFVTKPGLPPTRATLLKMGLVRSSLVCTKV